jgi:DNA-binding MarR family transcriptional regulator
VQLNVSAAKSDGERQPRRRLIREVLEEMTAWNPREFIASFRRWHRGAISLIHLNVLTLLEFEGAMPMSHLAEALDVSVASITGIVDRMERRGLVERRRDTADRRVVLVQPTPDGATVFVEIDRRRRDALARLMAGMTDDELRTVRDGFRAMRQARARAAKGRDDASAATADATAEATPRRGARP